MKNKKIKACAFGLDNSIKYGTAGLGFAGSLLQGVGNEGSGVDIAGSSLTGLGTGAATGMTVGGPIGAAIGGAVGLAGGLVSYFNRRKKLREAERRKQAADKQMFGEAITANMQDEYYENNPSFTFAMANGGILPDLAYVDNNEIIRDDNGNIMQVPNNKQGTDNHLINASTLDSVLSNRLKRPGTNRTFAQEGKRLMNMTNKTKGSDRFARASKQLNDINANNSYNQLLAEQEEVKRKRGIKPKVKGIPAYADGTNKWKNKYPYGILSWLVEGKDIPHTPKEEILKIQQQNPDWSSKLSNVIKEVFVEPSSNPYRLSKLNLTSPIWGNNLFSTGDNTVDAISGAQIKTTDNKYNNKQEILSEQSHQTPQQSKTSFKNSKNISGTSQIPYVSLTEEDLTDPTISFVPFTNKLSSKFPAAPKVNVDLDAVKPVVIDTKVNRSTPTRQGFNFDIGSLTGLSPILYNLGQSFRKPEYEETVFNPYAAAVTSALAKRRMNIDPLLEANRKSSAIARANAAKLNPNTGMNIAYNSQLNANNYAANGEIYANLANMNNQYLADYANMANNLGQQYAQARTLANDLNARNRAKARDFGAKAFGQLGQWSQTKEQMRNQARRDSMMLPYLQDYLSAVTNISKNNLKI